MELFKILGTIAINNSDAHKALGETEGKAKTLSAKLGSFLGKAGAVAAKATVAAVGAAATGVALISKQALDSYAEYEQLVGGAELLFGDAFGFIEQQSSQAYKNVQMSQNEYLQQVNGFATGLKTALNGDAQAAAELADRIITAEADVVAATGNSQEAVQNAFNGIMKSNFTMLDNLQLGITPTKEGFQELIDKVNDWNAANGRATDYQIDNLADCQSALVDYIEMQGISGYAAKEAAGTITGSLASTKAAWKDLVTGLGNENANLTELMNNFTQSAITAAGNVAPRITQILNGISTMITQMAPLLSQAIPVIINDVLPGMINAGAQIIQALLNGITQNVDAVASGATQVIMTLVGLLISNLPQIIQVGWQIIVALIRGIAQAAPQLVTQIVQTMALICGASTEAISDFFSSAFAPVIENVRELINSLKEKIQPLIDRLTGYVTSGEAAADATNLLKDAIQFVADVLETFTDLLNQALTWMDGHKETVKTIATVIGSMAAAFLLVTGVMRAYNAISSAVTMVTNGVKGAIAAITSPVGLVIAAIGALIAIFVHLYNTNEEFRTKCNEIWASVKEYVSAAVEQIKTAVSNFVAAVKAFWNEWGDDIISVASTAWTMAKEFVSSAVDGIIEVASVFIAAFQTFWSQWGDEIMAVASAAWDFIKEFISSAMEVISGVINTVSALIQGDWEGVWNGIKETFSAVWELIKTVVTTGVQLIQTTIATYWSMLQTLFSTVWNAIKEIVSSAWETIKEKVQTAAEVVKTKIEEMVEAVKTKFEELKTAVSEKFQEIVGAAEEKISSFLEIGSNIVNNIREGISNAWEGLVGWFQSKIESLKSLGGGIVGGIINAVGGGGGDGGGGLFKTGLDFVPRDQFPALLHKGEAVLDAEEASLWRAGKAAGDSAPATAQQQQGGESQTVVPIVFNVTSELDGMALAQKQYKYNLIVSRNHGVSLVQGV